MNVKQNHPAWLLLPALVLVVFVFSAAPALAASPVLTLDTISSPTNLPPGGEAKILLQITNLGDAPANGETSPIAIVEKLPVGLTATEAPGCEIVTPQTVHCVSRQILQPYQELHIAITVKVEESASTAPGALVSEVVLSGGGAALTTTRHTLTVSPTPASFGVEDLRLVPTNEDGSIDTQAGSHPFQLTTTTSLNTLPGSQPVALTKDLHFSLPAGLVGNAQVVPQCTSQEFDTPLLFGINACPAETAIGVAMVRLTGNTFQAQPVFNLVPLPGEPARFGFSVAHVAGVILDTAVRTGGDYGVVVSVNNVSQIKGLLGSRVTFWGVPADPSHNNVRGWGCLYKTLFNFELEPCVEPVGSRLIPFLTLPTSCSGPAGMRTTVEADSWDEPGVFTKGRESLLEEMPGEPLGLTGCNRLPFEPSIGVAPDGSAASTPSGLTVGVHVPQGGALNRTGLSPADVRDTTVALPAGSPAGVALNPAGADGLQACSDAQIGFLGFKELSPAGEPGVTTAQFTPAPPSCPDASKVGTVEIDTPLLPNALKGAVYLAAPQNFAAPPQENPFESLIAMYIVAEDPVSGTLVKLPGEVKPDPVTGQLVASFKRTPQLPFEDLHLHFFGGERAPLATPPRCGLYTTNASFAPWSGNEPAASSSTFEITSGPNGGPCPGASLPFAPTLAAGSPNINAGAFSPLTTTIGREDGNQDIQTVTLHTAPGMSGILAGVPLCADAQANAGTCPAASQIGETIVSVGLGGDPFTVTGGKVYLTEHYAGAPFGLSIVNPADAGPFHLGKVIVRATIAVDPTTAALTITTGQIPHILDGIPLQIKHVNVNINRQGFTFNPTNCNPMAITATIGSAEGASAPVSVPFQVTNCASLKFAPKFSVSTSGKTSKAKGASLAVKLTFPRTPQGTEANVASVKVDLPRVLPSRLKTLQKACLAKVFGANPAACPVESIVGHARAITPLLPVALEGPAYFVSHGGEAFPSLIVVLQGYGVTLDLVGTTFIKAGITSSTFKTVPDAPVGTFELTLSEGPYSALAANGNLCATTTITVKKKKHTRPASLVMPTAFVAQNGAVIHQSTKIRVTGCAKAKPAK